MDHQAEVFYSMGERTIGVSEKGLKAKIMFRLLRKT